MLTKRHNVKATYSKKEAYINLLAILTVVLLIIRVFWYAQNETSEQAWNEISNQYIPSNSFYNLGQRESFVSHDGAPWAEGSADNKSGKSATFTTRSMNVSQQSEGNIDGVGLSNSTLPEGFDWRTYLLYHPDLRHEGIATELQAIRHYQRSGKNEGRVYKRLRVVMRYSACTGLINQHYSHIASIALAAVLGAELVLPPAAQRDSFEHYFSTRSELNEVMWSPAPIEGLLDVEYLIKFWAARGLRIYRPAALHPFPDLTRPEVAFPVYKQPGFSSKVHTRMPGVYIKNLPLSSLVEQAMSAVVSHAERLQKEDPKRDVSTIVLDLPCSFFMLKSSSNLRLIREVGLSLQFSPSIKMLANKVISGILSESNAQDYNGVHLRIEKDARDWTLILGGPEMVWKMYVDAMTKAGFNNGLDVYVATGLLTYGSYGQFNATVAEMKSLGLCKNVHFKEKYLSQAETKGLSSEQKALVDFLVLAKSKSFVGLGSSTFSFFIREFRSLDGQPRENTIMLDSTKIGTDNLFLSAGVVSDPF